MFERKARSPGHHERWLRPTLSIAIASAVLLATLGGTAVAQKLIDGGDIKKGTVKSKQLKNKTIKLKDLRVRTREALQGAQGPAGPQGLTGLTGDTGNTGNTGNTGSAGSDGTDGTDGTSGTNGTDGTDGTDGVIAPLSASAGNVVLPGPAGTPPTEIVSLTVPAGPDYVVFAKTQLTHSGAGDKVSCVLFSGSDAIDKVAIAPGPALTEAPVSMQAMTTTSTTGLSVECDVLTADGTASSTSLIALPVG